MRTHPRRSGTGHRADEKVNAAELGLRFIGRGDVVHFIRRRRAYRLDVRHTNGKRRRGDALGTGRCDTRQRRKTVGVRAARLARFAKNRNRSQDAKKGGEHGWLLVQLRRRSKLPKGRRPTPTHPAAETDQRWARRNTAGCVCRAFAQPRSAELTHFFHSFEAHHADRHPADVPAVANP